MWAQEAKCLAMLCKLSRVHPGEDMLSVIP